MVWTKRRLELFEAMQAKVAEGTWVRNAESLGYAIRWARVLETPDYVRTWRGYENWGPDYDQHVSITLVTPESNPLMGVSTAPWVTSRLGIGLTLKRAFEVLEDPAAVLEPGRA
jgi:hypothetical protein